jgi:hypothetical protein
VRTLTEIMNTNRSDKGTEDFIEDLQVSPNTLDILHRMQPGLPGDRPPGQDLQ